MTIKRRVRNIISNEIAALKCSELYVLTAPKNMPAARELVRLLGGNA
jgi:hypothetical protein